jgi:hypothetical protein
LTAYAPFRAIPSGKFARSGAKVRPEIGVVQCRFEQHYAIFGMVQTRQIVVYLATKSVRQDGYLRSLWSGRILCGLELAAEIRVQFIHII